MGRANERPQAAIVVDGGILNVGKPTAAQPAKDVQVSVVGDHGGASAVIGEGVGRDDPRSEGPALIEARVFDVAATRVAAAGQAPRDAPPHDIESAVVYGGAHVG